MTEQHFSIKNRIFIRYRGVIWLMTAIYMAAVFFISSKSRPLGITIPAGVDKVVHFLEYAVMGCLLYFSLRTMGTKRAILFAWLIASFFGLTDELHQYFVPMRQSSLGDLMANTTGAFTGSILSEWLCFRGDRGQNIDNNNAHVK